jgi:exosortase A-associated hydrolase 1
MFKDTAISFECAGEQLFGVLSAPIQTATCGVLLIVGGPQYRVGSHRQFVALARHLANAGFAVLRFDYRGMGDSSGGARDFEAIDEDIRAAADALCEQCPGLERIVIWGLCDAASAACMYAPQDARIGGLILLNPWVREASSYARTQVKHYYGSRLLEPAFWKKLLRGEVRILQSIRETIATLIASLSKPALSAPESAPFQTRMLQGLQRFGGPVLLLISGRDLTAREFDTLASGSAAWSTMLQSARVQRVDFSAADHTFSSAPWKREIEKQCADWMNCLGTRANSNE